MVQESSVSPRDRRRMVVVGSIIGAAVVIAVGAWTLAPRHAASGVTGPGLSIAVVAPVEPVPVPGGILEVGTLNDGFDRAALDRQPEITTADYVPADAYVGEDWPPLEPVADVRPMGQPYAPVNVATVTTTDPLADGSRLFGFDRRREPAVSQSAEPDVAAIQSEPAKGDETFFE